MAKGTNKKTAWKGIQQKTSEVDRPASIASQDSRKTVESKDDSKDDSKVIDTTGKTSDREC